MADLSPLVSVAAVLVSAAVGGVTTWLALRKRSDEDSLARATRRTTAMQLLSDEEFTIIRVRDECQNIRHMVMLKEKDLGENHRFLAAEAERILEESRDLLKTARDRRRDIEPKVQSMSNTVNLDDEAATRIALGPSTSQSRAAWRSHQHRRCGLRRAVDRNAPGRTPGKGLVARVSALDHAGRAAVDRPAGAQACAGIKQAGEPPGALSRPLWGGRPLTGAVPASTSAHAR